MAYLLGPAVARLLGLTPDLIAAFNPAGVIGSINEVVRGGEAGSTGTMRGLTSAADADSIGRSVLPGFTPPPVGSSE